METIVNPSGQGRVGGDSKGLNGRVLVVLYGGRSMEREVSLESGRAVLAAFEAQEKALAGSAPAVGRARCGGILAVEVTVDGQWVVNGRALQPWKALGELPDNTLFFLGLHGGAGEDGTLQGFLELAGRPYTGSGVASSALCMDKYRARLAFEGAGLQTAPCVYLQAELWAGQKAHYLATIRDSVRGPYYVKPNAGGSSMLTKRVMGLADLEASIEAIVEAGSDALVEESIEGLEVTCGILGNRKTGLRALPVVEIVPEVGRFFDYEQKYSSGGAAEHCPPEYLSDQAAALIQARALEAYRAAGCDGYARVDFIMPAEGVRGSGEPVILEINTLPGFTPRSLLPMAARQEGISFVELCARIGELGLARS